MNNLDLMIGIFTDPAAALNEISYRKPIFWSAIIFLVFNMINNIISQYFVNPLFLQNRTYLLLYLFVVPLVGILSLLIMTFIFSVSGSIIGGEWDFWGLFSSFGFISVVNVILPFIALFVVRLNSQDLLYISFSILFIWTSILIIISLRECMYLGTGRALIAYFLSYVVGFILLAAAVIVPLVIFMLMGSLLI